MTSGEEASSGLLSSRDRMKRGKRMETPLDSWTLPAAAVCTGEIVKSAPRISHTSAASNQI
eukprot:CAMPEP_0182869288 /NCGR_PEP_ID=MMETSP0034_2-20130328/9842_1 /TAXON_ID=156128 /ORGANISM="Nephroselmis pyriformis, Strain CCMP717" /LENGTH=60 /DNA_ID=CAMNT_0025001737 /DNA_START=15 /DNA_END=197 /DNA_ORIENTATION=+